IGGNKIIGLDVRVLATTNRDLKSCAAKGTFREDLYYRLNVFPLHILPLRDRPEDILPLARLAIDRYSDRARPKPALAGDAVDKLLAHEWPGNVRELQNTIQRSLILLQNDTLSASDLIFEACTGVFHADAEPAAALQDNLKDHEQQIIIEALQASRGNRSAVAEKLGISPRTLRYKLARLRKAGVNLPFATGAGSTPAQVT
ncbi:MAG: sigma 54-interacting transcriptional regulator, partial [Holophagales bacterium]|nr:sigma 54-interacting transcriptional regulator [Holophagales bacterium]